MVVADKKITGLLKTVEIFETKVDYLENKSRQSNLLIYGVMEGEEEKNTVAFIRRFLPEILGRDIQVESPLQIERAHRISTRDTSRIRPNREVWELSTENKSDALCPGTRRTLFQGQKGFYLS